MDGWAWHRTDTQGIQLCPFDVEKPKENEPLQGESLGGGGKQDGRIGEKTWGMTGPKGMQRAETGYWVLQSLQG
jgi:hypothetical protein